MGSLEGTPVNVSGLEVGISHFNWNSAKIYVVGGHKIHRIHFDAIIRIVGKERLASCHIVK